MVINPKNLHPTLGTRYLTGGQSILTTRNLEPAGNFRVHVCPFIQRFSKITEQVSTP
jgi:hypothetical protein